MNATDDIWITGIGDCTSVGDDSATIGSNLLQGRSGIRAVEEFPIAEHPSRIAGRAARIPCPEGWEPAEFDARRPLELQVPWC